MKPESYAQKKQEKKVRVNLKVATPPPTSTRWNIVPEVVKLAIEYCRTRQQVQHHYTKIGWHKHTPLSKLSSFIQLQISLKVYQVMHVPQVIFLILGGVILIVLCFIHKCYCILWNKV